MALEKCLSCGLVLDEVADPQLARREAERAGSWAAMVASEPADTPVARRAGVEWSRYGATKAAHYGRRALGGDEP